MNLGVVLEATRVLLVEQILGEVVYMAAMALHVGQVNWVVSFKLTRVLLGKFGAKKDKQCRVVYDEMCETVSNRECKTKYNNIYEMDITARYLGLSWVDNMKELKGVKGDKTVGGMQQHREVVEYEIICEENQGSEGKTLKADILERSSLSFPSLNFSWGDVAHHPTCVVLAGLTSLVWNRRIAMDMLEWLAICSCGLDTWSCASQPALG